MRAQLAQPWPGSRVQFLTQDPLHLDVRLQRLGFPAACQQCHDQLLPEFFTQWMSFEQSAQFDDRLGAAAELDPHLQALFLHGKPQFVESCHG
jgi:hypothetical protein